MPVGPSEGPDPYHPGWLHLTRPARTPISTCPAVVQSKESHEAPDLTEELVQKPPLALRTLKGVLNSGADAPLEAAIALERKAYSWLRTTDDYEEGVSAFFENRPPKFQGK